MLGQGMLTRGMLRSFCSRALVGVAWLLACVAPAEPALAKGPNRVLVEKGQRLFERVWKPNDSEAKGDGLGPMFNERSCVACHRLGGIGGAGPNTNNAIIATAVIPSSDANLQLLQAGFAELHPGFGGGSSVILHRYSTNLPGYAAVGQKLLGVKPGESDDPIRLAVMSLTSVGDDDHGAVKTIKIAGKTLKLSERSTTPLFGLGLIASIPQLEIQRAAELQSTENPHVKGQFVGRFGWRGQINGLRDFVRGACANELGLQVTTQSQAMDPTATAEERRAEAKTDLTDLQSNELTVFVASLPAPRRLQPADRLEGGRVKGGEHVFEQVGCAVCHRPTLGAVSGLYSDLLVHDMGLSLSDPSPAPKTALVPKLGVVSMYYGGNQTIVMQSTVSTYGREQLWKTPPLWGLRDSGPYLHDGRALTVDEAITAHGGEATDSVERYRAVSSEERSLLLAFLDTLAAPDPASLPKPKESRLTAASERR
jgi:CxxC motif-containing protein (DUF1111 family)